MSTTNTSNTPSRSAQPRQNSTSHAGHEANRNARSTSSSEQAPVFHTTTRDQHDIDVHGWTPTPLPREYANTLITLTGWLKDLNDPGCQLDADDVIRFFDSLKAAEKNEALPNVIRHYPQEPGLGRFVNALTAFLGRLDRDMEHTDKLLRHVREQTDHDDLHYAELQELLNDSDNPQAFNLSGLSSGELRTMCLGLAVCANPNASMPFTGKQFEKASTAVQGITDKVLRLVRMAGLPDAGKSISVVLDITNWITRGSKAGFLVPSQTIKDMVPRFLDAFLTWAPAPEPDTFRDDAGSVQGDWTTDALPQSDKKPHQIGNCAVQIMPIYQNGLIELDLAGCADLQKLALNLCSDAFLNQVDKPPIQGVAVINLTNMIKDCIEAGLLSLAEPRLPAILKGLLELIGKLPVSEMVKDGGRTLSNASNFLRVLIERHLKEPATFPAVARTAFNAVCTHVVACTNAATHLPEQSTTNLLSFMKALDKWIELPNLSKLKEWTCLQSGMLDAVGKLINRAIALGGARFTAQEALGGLLSALAYFQERRLDMPGTLQEFLRELMGSVAAIKPAAWGRQGRGQVLLAMEVMADMEILSIDDMRDALTELLGPCRAPSGVYTLQDLSAAVNRLGPIRDVVVALPPQPAPAPAPERTLRSPLSADPITPPPRPGFTSVKAAPVAAMAEQKAATKKKGQSAATSNTTASTSTTSTSISSTSTTSAPRSSTRSDASHEVGFELAKRTARPNQTSKATAMAVTAPVLETRHADAPAKRPTPAQTTAATQTTKPGPGSSHDNDDSLSESAPGNGKPDAKAKSAGAKGSAKPTAAAAGSGPKAASGKQVVASDAQKSGGIAPQQKWFDQLTKGAVSLVKLQRLAEVNPELLNAKDKSGRTAIFYAVTRGKSDVVDWLMEHELHRLEGSTKPFLNALFSAVAAGSPEIVKALNAFVRHASKGRYIREPADLETFSIAWIKKQPWLTPLFEAAGLNVRPAPDAVLESSVHLSSRARRIRADQLNLALLMGPNAVREHLAAFPRPSPEILMAGGIALLTALVKGMDAQARILMEHWSGDFIDQALIHTPGNPLNAEKSISDDSLKLLIRHKNAKLLGKEFIRSNCCLAEAIVLDKLSHATILLDAMDDERLASSRAGSHNALALAANQGNELIVSKLLSRAPAMAKEKTNEGKTPLDIAREMNHAGVVEILTRHAGIVVRPETTSCRA